LPLPAGQRMAVHIGRVHPIAIGTGAVGGVAIIDRTAVIDRTASVVDRTTAVIIVIIGLPVLGGGDRDAGADNAGKGCRRGSTAAAMIDPAARADIGGAAGPGGRAEALCRGR